ncbi:phosphotransferase enzyme family protein [Venturia nashicola]|nr:phosphotransferase enzyme family protein [Venturia nashicola]
MNFDERYDILHEIQKDRWVSEVAAMRERGELARWVSTYHRHRLSSATDGTVKFINGGYNLCQKLTFTNGDVWLVRFAQKGVVCDDLADEKVAMEVEALMRIRQETDIPVPKVHGWGTAANNPLGLGPFIIMDFIGGVSLESLWKERPDKRLIRSNIAEADIEYIYRQFARIQLKLFQLNFERIGSLPTPLTNFVAPIRPLTFKIHDILQMGGVNTFGRRSEGFESTNDYFHHVCMQDWEQLSQQANSVCGLWDAKNKLASFNALRIVVRDFVHQDTAKGPFKLVSEDFGLSNILVRTEDDLTIVGVVDLEWSYAGPAQLAASPWLLLNSRLNLYDLEFEAEAEASAVILDRYLKHLEIYKRVLGEEEERMPDIHDKGMSSLIEWSESSGALWFHMLLHSGFNYVSSIPFAQVRKHIGDRRWDKLKSTFPFDSLEALATSKAQQTEEYEKSLEQVEDLKTKVDTNQMDMDDFIAAASSLLVTRVAGPVAD